MPARISKFNFQAGDMIGEKYSVVAKLGKGLEGEVYLLRERLTGVERAGKFFFPHRNVRGQAARRYARKLHKLRHCPVIIQYHHEERVELDDGTSITALVSEFVEGETLHRYLRRQRGRRLSTFEALHLLHAMAEGIEQVHYEREYHGDLHEENIIVQRRGLKFELKLLDMFHWGATRRENYEDDLCGMIRVFYEVVGGAKRYASQPPMVKAICCGLKRSLILRRFRSAGGLRLHLENLEWE